MAGFGFTGRAKTDLFRIGDYTINTWGEDRAARYLAFLEDCVRMLACNPGLGRPCNRIRSGLYRFEQGRHVIFYRRETSGILVIRILHQSMLPENYSFEEKNPGA